VCVVKKLNVFGVMRVVVKSKKELKRTKKTQNSKLKKQISQRNELCDIHDRRLAEGVYCF
jgi:hypothetical protein